VSVLASASPRNLVPGSRKYPPAEMYVSLEKRGEQKRGLVIAENGSHEFSGNDRLPIGEPQGFRWKSVGPDLLVPDYRAVP
jgi:hypothetical protein